MKYTLHFLFHAMFVGAVINAVINNYSGLDNLSIYFIILLLLPMLVLSTINIRKRIKVLDTIDYYDQQRLSLEINFERTQRKLLQYVEDYANDVELAHSTTDAIEILEKLRR